MVNKRTWWRNSDLMKPEQKERSKICSHLAHECWQILEPKLQEVAEKLETNMEISHFLACLDNRLAITIAMRFNVEQVKD